MVLNIFDLWNALIPKSDILIVPKTFIMSVFGSEIIILEMSIVKSTTVRDERFLINGELIDFKGLQNQEKQQCETVFMLLTYERWIGSESSRRSLYGDTQAGNCMEPNCRLLSLNS